MDVKTIRTQTLGFIQTNALPSSAPGCYRYSSAVNRPTLYSSTYAAKTRFLYNDLDSLSDDERTTWIDYFNILQDDDGLYRDPVIFDQGWYKDDPLWCGRPHLTCSVISALACLGAVAEKEIGFVSPYCDIDFLLAWLEKENWDDKIAWTGNEIMNIGTLLQYERDFHNNQKAEKAVSVLLEWLSKHHINPDTGMWGSLDVSDSINLSHAVQAAYHWWPLFFHDYHPVPYIEQAIDSVLMTKNPLGGFGCGVHNSTEPHKSSACEDIDSIDPLCRMMQLTNYRHDDIAATLEKAISWVLKNQMKDGGFVFILDKEFEYGHPELKGERNTGAMFPSWFRTLSLALIGKALPESWTGKYDWQFVDCPGTQFWRKTK